MSKVTIESVQAWLDRYVEAWRSNAREPILALFADDASYRYGPFDKPLLGRQAIADSWLKNPDPPDSWAATYRPIAIEGDLAVAHGRSQYFEEDRTKQRTEYDNIFVMRFDGQGRCIDFTEWYIERPKNAAAAG
jgi:hypothetical protein